MTVEGLIDIEKKDGVFGGYILKVYDAFCRLFPRKCGPGGEFFFPASLVTAPEFQ